MSNFEELKYPKTAISISTLTAVGVSLGFLYMYNEISKLKTHQTSLTRELQEIKKHLSSLILSNPENHKRIGKITAAIEKLETRLEETQEKIKHLSFHKWDAKAPKNYQRLTKRTKTASSGKISKFGLEETPLIFDRAPAENLSVNRRKELKSQPIEFLDEPLDEPLGDLEDLELDISAMKA